jgi:tetratricopeptide (TPR) repeat protein
MPALERGFVFISYAHENLAQVLKVYEGLKKRKVNVWIDKKNMGPGKWKPEILKAISRSKYFVICLSNAAIKKTSGEKPGFQDEELQTAWEFAREQDERGFTIIPVRLEDCGRGDMRLSGWQQYDLFPDLKKGLDKLAVDLGGDSLADARVKDERTEDEKMVARLMGWGTTYYYLGEYDKALSILEAIINIYPDNSNAWSNKGVALANLGQYKQALEAYNKAIEIRRNHAVSWYNKSVILSAISLEEEAIIARNKAIEIEPDFVLATIPDAPDDLAFMEEKTTKKSIPKNNLDDYEVWCNKGVTLAALGRHDEALEAYNKAIEIKPDSHLAWYNKGVALAVLGRRNESLVAFNKAIEIKPDYYSAWYNKGVRIAALGRHDEALEAYNMVIEIKPEYYPAWYNKGVTLAALGCHDEALEAYNTAIEIKPDYYSAWYNKGFALEKIGKKKAAQKAFEKANEIKKKSK